MKEWHSKYTGIDREMKRGRFKSQTELLEAMPELEPQEFLDVPLHAKVHPMSDE